MKLNKLCVLFVCLAACGDSSSSPTDGGPSGDGPVQGDGPAVGQKLVFTSSTVDDQNAGLYARIASGGGTVGIAYYREPDPADWAIVNCPPSPLGPGGPEARQEERIYYSSWDGSAWSTPVLVDNTVGPAFGLGLVMDGSGNPHIAYTGGQVNTNECNSGDAMLITSTNGGTSFGAPTTVYDAHTTGDTVGNWPTVALDGAGAPQMVFRDVRFGLYTQDGNIRSSVVFGAGENVFFENGYGEYSKLIYDTNGDPVVMTTRNDQGGDVAIAHRISGTWNTIDLMNFAPAPYPDFATDGNGNFMLAYYSPGSKALEFRETTDPLAGWSAGEQVDISLTDHGRYTSIAYDNNGNPAISYHRCSNVNSSNCEPDEDAVMLAYRVNGNWKITKVDEGGDRTCGEYTGLAFDSQNSPMVVYQCDKFDNGTQTFISTVKVARGVWQ